MPGRLADWRRKLLNAQTVPGIILRVALGTAVGIGAYTFVRCHSTVGHLR